MTLKTRKIGIKLLLDYGRSISGSASLILDIFQLFMLFGLRPNRKNRDHRVILFGVVLNNLLSKESLSVV